MENNLSSSSPATDSRQTTDTTNSPVIGDGIIGVGVSSALASTANTTDATDLVSISSATGTPERPSFNPAITEDLESEIEKIKGDAIGDTLYSCRFVLNTLMKLTKYNEIDATPIADDETFEKDLCYLWDMTIEKDVVHLLLEHDVLDVFAGIIRTSSDERLIEILVGIIGNCCSLSKTRNILCNNSMIMSTLLDLIACTDSLVLIQLMRLLHTAMVFENSGDELLWFEHFRNADNFIERFSIILSNSMSTPLLIATYEALNSMCSKFSVIEIMPDVNDTCFRDTFVNTKLIQSVIEAFKQMLPADVDVIDETAPTERTHKIMTLFLDINDTLTQYEQVSLQAYEPIMDEFLLCICKILTPLCRLFPMTIVEQTYIETINELFQLLGDRFHADCFMQMIRIWSAIDVNTKTMKKRSNDWGDDNEGDDDDEEDEQVHTEDIQMSILDFVTRVSKNGSAETISQAIRTLNVDCVKTIYSALSAGDSEPDIEECCEKLKIVLKSLWDVDV